MLVRVRELEIGGGTRPDYGFARVDLERRRVCVRDLLTLYACARLGCEAAPSNAPGGPGCGPVLPCRVCRRAAERAWRQFERGEVLVAVEALQPLSLDDEIVLWPDAEVVILRLPTV